MNCRILPGGSIDEVRQTLVRVLADERIAVRPIGEAVVSPAPPMTPQIMQAVADTVQANWPGVPVLPTMVVASTDGKYLNNAGIWTYGVGAFYGTEDSGVHGLNEHIRVKALNEYQEFMYQLGKKLAL